LAPAAASAPPRTAPHDRVELTNETHPTVGLSEKRKPAARHDIPSVYDEYCFSVTPKHSDEEGKDTEPAWQQFQRARADGTALPGRVPAFSGTSIISVSDYFI